MTDNIDFGDSLDIPAPDDDDLQHTIKSETQPDERPDYQANRLAIQRNIQSDIISLDAGALINDFYKESNIPE